MSDQTELRPDTDAPWPQAGRASSETPLENPVEATEPIETDDQPSSGRASEDAAAWIGGGAGTGDNGRGNGVRLAVVAAFVGLAVVKLGAYGLAIIAALVASIVLHEFGHYWVAKRCGMKVTEFFLGFGPRLFSFRRGETEYGLKPIPAGAYVKIIGMNQFDEVDPADEARTYRAQSAPKRIAAVVAGPAMNLMLAFVLFIAFFIGHGKSVDTWALRSVEAGSAAAQAGLEPGDRVLTVDGQPAADFEGFAAQLSDKAGEPVTLQVDRGGQTVTTEVSLGWRLDATTAAAFPSTPALKRSDIIRSADGVALATYEDLRTLLAQSGDPVTLRVERARHPYDLLVQRPYQLPEVGSAGYLGVSPTNEYEDVGAVGAVGESAKTMGEMVVGTGAAFGRLFSPSGIADYAGQVVDATQTPTTLARATTAGVLTPVDGSPAPQDAAPALSENRPTSIVGIFQMGSEAAEIDLWLFIGLVASVNLALGLINLVPMLPLDGGHIAIAAYEGIRGRLRGAPYRADITKLMPFVYAFVAVLLVLGTTSIMLDVLRPQSLR